MKDRRGSARLLALTILAAVFLCQVIGVLCPMSMPPAFASPLIVAVHAHSGGEGPMCQDSLASHAKENGSRATQSPAIGDVVPPPMGPVISGLEESVAAASVFRPLLFRLLSTFRI